MYVRTYTGRSDKDRTVIFLMSGVSLLLREVILNPNHFKLILLTPTKKVKSPYLSRIRIHSRVSCIFHGALQLLANKY